MDARFTDQPTDRDLAWRDVREVLATSWFWLSLGWNDIVMRYRGSMLGPFWLTITTAVFIIGLGPLYASLFRLSIQSYLPHLACGIIVWNFIVTTLNEACRIYIEAAGPMKQIRMPRLTPVLHALWRNIIVFAHALPVLLAVLWYGNVPIGWWTALAIPGLAVVTVNLLSGSVILAILCARYRDVVQIVASILLIAFFLTPVMWDPSMQKVPEWVIWLNPFAALLELVRAPLLGREIAGVLVFAAALWTAMGVGAAGFLFVRYRKSIIYWV